MADLLSILDRDTLFASAPVRLPSIGGVPLLPWIQDPGNRQRVRFDGLGGASPTPDRAGIQVRLPHLQLVADQVEERVRTRVDEPSGSGRPAEA